MSETDAIVFHCDSSVVASTAPSLVIPAKSFDPPTDWLFATTELSSLPDLNVSYLESEKVALSAATAINVSQLVQLLVLLSGLMTAIWLAARLAGHPLNRMLEQVVAIEKTSDLSLRVDQDGPTEFVSLAEGFNGMLGKLQQTTVSQEQYRTSEERAHAQKMESVGQLAAGVAHELNTPIQFVGDNTNFLKTSFEDLDGILSLVQSLLTQCRAEGVMKKEADAIEAECDRLDLDFIRTEIPLAAKQTLEGTNTLARIVQAMKVFSHPGTSNFESVDLNRALESTLTISKSEWKYHAELVTEFCEDLPLVSCMPGEINQVFLNMIVNAAHAMTRNNDAGPKNKLTVRTAHIDSHVVIEVSDTGTGISESIQHRIFDPFFTTKVAGKGTGQGLSICYNIVVGIHGGEMSFDSVPGAGTTFRVRLPNHAHRQAVK